MLQLNADIYETDPELEQIRKDQGYSYMDIIQIHKDTLPNYEEKVTQAQKLGILNWTVSPKNDPFHPEKL